MQQHEIHDFLLKFFTVNGCEVKQEQPGLLNIQLTEEMDKALMNRPFYWHYLKKTGGVPQPMELILVTDKRAVPAGDKRSEMIHFGSPRLHQIFKAAKAQGACTRLFEDRETNGSQKVPLQPWLVLNMNVAYECDKKKDRLHSIGLNLINGTIVSNCQQFLQSLKLTPKIPDYSFTLTPMIKPESGIKRIQKMVEDLVMREDHSWADGARERWQQDLALLEHFYEGSEERPEAYHAEKEALQSLYEPKISVTIINGGLFYLTPFAFLKSS